MPNYAMITPGNCDDYLPLCQMTTTHSFFSVSRTVFKLEKINIPKASEIILSLHTSNAFIVLFLLENFNSMRKAHLLTPFSHYSFIL